MSNKIICVWESPRNEGTKRFTVGARSISRDWTVGKIVELEGGWYHESEGRRLEVYDTDDNLRITLPMSACAVECEAE